MRFNITFLSWNTLLKLLNKISLISPLGHPEMHRRFNVNCLLSWKKYLKLWNYFFLHIINLNAFINELSNSSYTSTSRKYLNWHCAGLWKLRLDAKYVSSWWSLFVLFLSALWNNLDGLKSKLCIQHGEI